MTLLEAAQRKVDDLKAKVIVLQAAERREIKECWESKQSIGKDYWEDRHSIELRLKAAQALLDALQPGRD